MDPSQNALNRRFKYYLTYWVGDGGDQESFNVYYSHLLRARGRQEAQKLAKRIMNADYITGDDDEILENLTEDGLVNKSVIGLREMELHESPRQTVGEQNLRCFPGWYDSNEGFSTLAGLSAPQMQINMISSEPSDVVIEEVD